MRLGLFPLAAGVWNLSLPAEFDAALYDDLMRVNGEMRRGSEIWERVAHDVFDGSVPRATQLAEAAMPRLAEFIGPSGRAVSLQGREVVRERGVEIMPHADEDECHLQGVYFPVGPEFDPLEPILPQINRYGSNAFAICNPDWRASGFGAYRMPWELGSKFWVAPHRGLLICFDARAVHFQKPYQGDRPFLQVLLNVKVERVDE